MKTFRYRGVVLVSAVAAVVAAGYGQQALSQTPAKNGPAKTVKKTLAPARSLTLERLAARLSALEAENRKLRERVAQLEKAPVIVPLSSRSQTAEGYVYYGMPLLGYVPQSPSSTSTSIVVPPASASGLPLSQRLNSTHLYNRLYNPPGILSPYGPPPRIPDPRDVDGMMLLRTNPNAKP